MLALRIDFLTGRYVATAHDDRRRSEWPPHPARVFSALVATHFDDPEADAGERAALEWLEHQPPPELHATDADARDVVDVFVPVNDASVLEDVTDDLAEAEAARAALAAADAKEHAKARKALDKAEARLQAKVARAVAPHVGKLSAADLRLGESLLPERRIRQSRTFPSVTPREPRVTLVWRDADADAALRMTLDRLAARVARLGHSSSLVSMRILPPDERLQRPYRIPDPDGEYLLRGVGPGQLERLCRDHEVHQGVASGRTMPAIVHNYAEPRAADAAYAHTVFGDDDWIVFARELGPSLPATRAVGMAKAVRGALQRFSPVQPPPELVSGHKPAGQASEQDHLAIVPLPFVGDPYAGGEILGVAVIFPRTTGAQDRNVVLKAIHAWEQATGRHEASDDDEQSAPDGIVAGGDEEDNAPRRHASPRVVVRLPGGAENYLSRLPARERQTLTARRWCRPSRVWATATPIALDRHPGDLRSRDPDELRAAVAAAEETIAAACRRIGLPTPRVTVVPAAPVAGAFKARAFPSFPPVVGRTQRVLAHALVEFAEPVRGPLLLGAGRYVGLGLLFPCGDAR